ncbi:MAG: class I SAM-dependent methyltransferase [Candidatus Omnitrophica bacterium]|nr:class I SAM-dependent methyltransferase [Candidatus Omnitrophota bacterium]
MLSGNSTSLKKEKIQRFWGDVCKQWYTDFDLGLTSESLDGYLVDLEEMFKQRRHLAVTEMPLKEIKNKQILEIGSGGGAHSALFKKYGACMTSVDITKERVVSTARKLSLVKEGAGLALQADAENLPFLDDSFDFVYSNGVLHHSENTEKCIKEVQRVLKPKGKAILMLYSRHSALYWLNLLPKSIFSGMVFRYPQPEWLGILTEGKPKFDSIKNPMTRVYSRKELLVLLGCFEIKSLRKNSFSFSQLPIINHISLILAKALKRKAWQSGILVYGAPNYVETDFEKRLGAAIGFGWNIVASKKARE